MATMPPGPNPFAHIGPRGLKSKWDDALSTPFSSMRSGLEGEVADLQVYGEIPKEIDGTFYRIMVDPFYPLHPRGNIPIEGDGSVCAIRIHNSKVDMKTKYVETERLKLERMANERMFGLYRNPFTHHPCVRAAVDSTANTNLVVWAGHLLALKEVALPYAVDPDTLETRRYDPFGGQVEAKTFTAHPKVDPYTEELVTYGYEAKGLCSLDIVVYTLDKAGKVKDEHWVEAPWPGLIHDCAISENFIILLMWPFESDLNRIKNGEHHWNWNPSRPATFVVVPRRVGKNLPAGWTEGEHRVYEWENCVCLHTASAYEEDGKLYFESSRVFDQELAFFPIMEGQTAPPPTGKADFVRWEMDLSKPSGTKIPDPLVILDLPSEFPRIDERFMSKKYEFITLCGVFGGQGRVPLVFPSLNCLAMVNTRTGATKYWNPQEDYPGEQFAVQEPVFIPRSSDAPEGDGWVMAMVERLERRSCFLVLLDTRNFEVPIAIINLAMLSKTQIHGNWVEATGEYTSLVKDFGGVTVSGRGSLEKLP
jgi:carotenoid cleavage dioxygenase-like enzyme